MKYAKFFLAPMLLMVGCEKGEREEVVDLDQMVLQESEVNQHLAGEPLESPQEITADTPLNFVE